MVDKPKITSAEFNKANEDDIYRISVGAIKGMWDRFNQAKRIWNEVIDIDYNKIEKSLYFLGEALAIGANAIAELSTVEGPGKEYAEKMIKKVESNLKKILEHRRSLSNLRDEKYKGLTLYDFN